ncbi:hypothetical protein [Streptomyces violarus]|uniref:hypothetical protein n=1 Tax=Streptomyces violarus TaxID=67380 RepID=UPI0021C06A50|nr:hypothetical protein [Streptomyces violarus]MCT9141793.1 hypothetical protein [Streptomyces violarus]
MDANLTILLICVAVLIAACYAIRHLASTPARVAAAIVALATLVGALKPIVVTLSEQRSPAQTVAPHAPSVSAPSPEVPPTQAASTVTGSR